MKFEISGAFVKDAGPLPKYSKRIILSVINEIESAEKPSDIKECSKLKGVENLFRIRRGNYRITFQYDGGIAILKRLLTRGQIYKKHNLR